MYKKLFLKGLLVALCFSFATPTQAGFLSKSAKTLGVVAVLSALYVGAQLYCGNTLNDVWMFAKEFAKNPREMGGFGPCSPYLGDAATACIQAKQIGQKPRRFLEVGPGTGSVTRRLVKKMVPGDTLDLVEMQPELCRSLEREFCSPEYKDFNIAVHEKMIQDFKPSEKYDSIVITVPFNAFPAAVVKDIWAHVLRMLADGGTVSYVAYCQMDKLKKMEYFFDAKKTADYKVNLTFLSDLHKLYGVGKATEYKNVLPINTFYFKFNNPADIRFDV
ncbi:methyltransferase domain-containing protein [Candidatus Dependentiae bacterium]|nr:methyltransferase domain-containing protein [Candidatus Dependentiae bacterium]